MATSLTEDRPGRCNAEHRSAVRLILPGDPGRASGTQPHALYEATPGPLRIALYRDSAQALTASGARVERVAELILAAIEAADGWEVDWLVGNAAQLSHRAPAVAVGLFEHALSHADEQDPRHAVLADDRAAMLPGLVRLALQAHSRREIADLVESRITSHG